MDFHQLEIFTMVMKYKNFSRAAEALYLTQPTVSAHIKSLEKELSLTLFERQGTRLRPTKNAIVLNEYARNLLALKEKTLYALQKQQSIAATELEIIASSVPVSYLLPQAVYRFQSLHPSVTFNIVEDDTKNVVRRIYDGNYHFGLVGEFIPRERLEYIPIANDELVLIASPKIAAKMGWQNKTQLSILDCQSCPFILRPPTSGTRRLWENALLNKGLSIKNFNIAAIVHSSEGVKEMVAEGSGVSVVSALTIRTHLQAGTLQAFKFSDLHLCRKFYLLSRKKRVLPPAAHLFKEFIQLFFQEDKCVEKIIR